MPLTLFPFQEEGAKFLAPRSRAGLFDEMGVGKTSQAIRAADQRQAIRGFVVCPAALRENWLGEFKKFQRIPRRVIKGVTIHDFIAWRNGRFDVLVMSFDMAVKWAPYIHESCEVYDFGIIDEAHYLKDDETKRAKAILGNPRNGDSGIMMWCQAAWWLTGTPVPNDPADIYTFLRFAKVMPLRRNAFVDRYFHSRQRTYSTTNAVNAAMLPELHKLIGNNSIRRTLAQTGIELPPLFTTTSLVDGDTQPVRDLLSSHPGLDNAIIEAVQNGGLSRLDAEWISTLRRLIGEAKSVPYAAQLAYELNNGLDKMIVFGVHRQALRNVRDYLWSQGIEAVMVTGESSENERMRAVERFQNDNACRVFLGNIRAAGVGLTLTASSHLDMLESDWTPAGNAQAIKRAHRIGQARTVRARFISLANSFDQSVNEIVAEKTAQVSLLETY